MAKKNAKPTARSPRLANKKARYQYEILERIEAGIALKGTEVKSLRLGGASLDEAFARIDKGQVTLHNFQILPYAQGNRFNHDPKRIKSLLLHRREIRKLAVGVQIKGQTLIALCVYFNDKGLAKVELALARGKKLYDKRQDQRKRQDDRDMARAISKRRS
jgi:SsrA-binding protein